MKLRILSSLLLFVFVVIGLFVFPHQRPSEPASTRYSKISLNGLFVSPWQGPWSCIYDQKTKLLWEKKTDDEGVHHANWTYSWLINSNPFESDLKSTQIPKGTSKIQGASNKGDCHLVGQQCDTQDLVDATNNEQLCGATRWRLPTYHELNSIRTSRHRIGTATIDTDFFPFILSGDYWSATKEPKLDAIYSRHGKGARSVNFFNNNDLRLPYQNAAFVILVSDDISHLTITD
ncbi:DUF1566 domain-containing protein [Vibrio cionasavignyae]|uniref:Lcl C-terminal domain-containing protein n=1 Tax=Vibrio cionasavignyae TaxID=2910252 RepID=UPI003D136255